MFDSIQDKLTTLYIDHIIHSYLSFFNFTNFISSSYREIIRLLKETSAVII